MSMADHRGLQGLLLVKSFDDCVCSGLEVVNGCLPYVLTMPASLDKRRSAGNKEGDHSVETR